MKKMSNRCHGSNRIQVNSMGMVILKRKNQDGNTRRLISTNQRTDEVLMAKMMLSLLLSVVVCSFWKANILKKKIDNVKFNSNILAPCVFPEKYFHIVPW